MLIGNYSVLTKSAGRSLGGSTLSPEVHSRSNWGKAGANRNCFYGDQDAAFSEYSGTPQGYVPPYCWVIAQKTGDMASFVQIQGSGVISSANLAGGLYGVATIAGTSDMTGTIAGAAAIVAALSGSGDATASITALGHMVAALAGVGSLSAEAALVGEMIATLAGSGDLTAAMSLIVSAVATLSGSGTISNADMGLLVSAAATLNGSGTVGADITATAAAVAALSGSGSLVATMGALAGAVATLTGTGSLTAGIRATGDMSAEITSFEELSPQNLARAVWEALVASFDSPGTMGEAMATAGAGGLSPTQVTMLQELWRIHGLDVANPLVADVTGETRKVPADGSEIEQTVVTVGGVTTVTRQ